MAWLRQHWFLVGLLSVTALAFAVPELGARGGMLRTEWTTKAAVWIVFLVQGLVLPTGELLRGGRRWRFHLGVQTYLFGANLALAVVAMALVGSYLPREVELGFLFLGVLPTTISTALVYTARAGGNVSETLVNISLSNLLAIVLVPTWMLWVSRGVAGNLDPLPVLVKIIALIFVPLALGQLLRPFLHAWVDPRRGRLNTFNSTLILFIVFASFAQSVASGAWQVYGAGIVASIVALALGLLLSTQALVLLLAKVFRLERADCISFFFTGTFKSLAAGVPMAGSIFSEHPTLLGGLILPVLCYALFQLTLGSLWAAPPASLRQ